MSQTRKLGSLIKLAGMKKAAALAHLSALQRRQVEKLEQIRRLDLDRQNVRAGVVAQPTGALQAQKYDEWAAEVRLGLEVDLEDVARECARSQVEASRAFGRNQALEQLLREIAAQDKCRSDARNE